MRAKIRDTPAAGRPGAGVAAGHLPRHPRGFRLDLVKLARGDLHDQVVRLVVGERQVAAVEAAEGDRRCKGEPSRA